MFQIFNFKLYSANAQKFQLQTSQFFDGVWWSSDLEHQPYDILVMLKVEGLNPAVSQFLF